MTIEQSVHREERPLTAVDIVAEDLAGAGETRRDPLGGVADHSLAAGEDVQRRLEADANRRRAVAAIIATIGALALVVVAAVLWNRLQPRPQSTEDLILERSREAFERSREALDTIIAKLGSLPER